MRFFLFVLSVLVLAAGTAQAQAQAPVTPAAAVAALPATEELAALPERIIRPMRATGPMMLKAEGLNIRLWGIKPAETRDTPLELKALDLMDSLINDRQVNCRISGGAVPDLVARCATAANQDLALELLSNGFVVVDRQQTYNSVFATGYEKAQEQARLGGRGVWKFLTAADDDAPAVLPKWLRPHLGVVLPLALIFGPLAGLLAVAIVMHLGLRRLGHRQDSEQEAARRKEAGLQLRERSVLVSTLEAELVENKNKIEAFLTIYGDMLKTLQDPVSTPKYQQVGDIVQKHPAFSKTVFEANVGRLSLLDIKLAGAISRLYSGLSREQEYINLEPGLPLETALKLVEKILHDADALLPQVEQVLKSLQAAQKE